MELLRHIPYARTHAQSTCTGTVYGTGTGTAPGTTDHVTVSSHLALVR